MAYTGNATAGTVLQATTSDPKFSTATYPSTAGTSGKVLISDGTNIVSSTPTFPNASATSGKFIRSDGTNWIASTPTLPTSAGTSGKVLQSDGTNYVESTPTYPSASGSAGKILRSDGTNNVYSTATYPDTASTSGNVLTSDGTNFVSSSPKVVQIVFSNNLSGSSTTSLTFVDVTNASLSITPTSASNKVLVMFSFESNAANGSGVNIQLRVQIVRGASTVLTGSNTMYTGGVTGTGGTGTSAISTICIVDSPATTSSTTYKLQHDVNSATSSSTTNVTITLMEIVA